jgi:hypothetical protein
MSLESVRAKLAHREGESGRIGENQDAILPSLTPFHDSRLQPARENRENFPLSSHARGRAHAPVRCDSTEKTPFSPQFSLHPARLRC